MDDVREMWRKDLTENTIMRVISVDTILNANTEILSSFSYSMRYALITCLYYNYQCKINF